MQQITVILQLLQKNVFAQILKLLCVRNCDVTSGCDRQ